MLSSKFTILVSKGSEYQVVEQALLYSLAMGSIEHVKDVLDFCHGKTVSENALSLAGIVQFEAQGQWERAAHVAENVCSRHPTYVPIPVHGAFCWLCAGDAERAQQMLDYFPGEFRHEAGFGHIWLAAMIQIELSDADKATELLEIYLGRPLATNEQANRATLLRLWDAPVVRREGRPPAYDLPTLPPSVTKLPVTYTRKQHDAPVLPSDLEPQLAGATGTPTVTETKTEAQPVENSASRSAWNSRQILIAMRPEGWSGLYVVGCFDRRITFYAQQCRALTLIRALFETGDLQASQRVGIVGGGAAGVTAAVAAAEKGCQVTLYERGDAVLHLQAAAQHRFLHPHLYDWPQPGSLQADAGLPLLNWSANYAHRVVQTLRDDVQEYVSQYAGRLNIHPRSDISQAEQISNTDARVRLIGNEADINQTFHVVIMAVGFGLEPRQFNAVAMPSYWGGDPLAGPFTSQQRILVSGSGDGGLIDLARAALRTDLTDNVFRHDQALETLTTDPQLSDLAQEMSAIDQKAHDAHLLQGEETNLYQAYKELAIPDSILARIRDLKRSDTDVTFNFRSPDVFTLWS